MNIETILGIIAAIVGALWLKSKLTPESKLSTISKEAEKQKEKSNEAVHDANVAASTFLERLRDYKKNKQSASEDK